MREAHRTFRSVVEFGSPLHPRSHEASTIHDGPNRLAAFCLPKSSDEVPTARSRGPADVASLVSHLEFPKAPELPTLPALSNRPALQFDLSAPDQHCLLLSGVSNRWVDSN